jgi:hypothetical protein
MVFRLQNLRRLIGLASLLVVAAAQAAKVEIDIDGLKNELKDAARANLSLQQYADRDAPGDRALRFLQPEDRGQPR